MITGLFLGPNFPDKNSPGWPGLQQFLAPRTRRRVCLKVKSCVRVPEASSGLQIESQGKKPTPSVCLFYISPPKLEKPQDIPVYRLNLQLDRIDVENKLCYLPPSVTWKGKACRQQGGTRLTLIPRD